MKRGQRFDPTVFGSRVAVRMSRTGVTYRELEDKTGVNHGTIYRVVSGRPPSVENYLRLKEWLDGDASDRRDDLHGPRSEV